MDKTIGIYIHIPFCLKKCPYCDFNSYTTADIPEDAYIEALIREFTFHIKDRPFLSEKILETIYIGGGTPSLIAPHKIMILLNSIFKAFPVSVPEEITVEINPGTVTRESLALLKTAGVNRLSIGVQSFNDKTLRKLGRLHNSYNSLMCYENAREVGFKNIGIDLIFGTSGQTVKEWDNDLKTALALRPEHISTYNLTIEKGTQFFEIQRDGGFFLPSEEEQISMYELAIDSLKNAAYTHYEISNFSLNGFQSCHNMRYWSGVDYIGLGAGAHSYISSSDSRVRGNNREWGVRWWNESDPALYMRQINDTGIAVAGEERLSSKEALQECILLGLRKISGINSDRFLKMFNFSLNDKYASEITSLKNRELIYEDEIGLRLTRKGLLLSNEVINELM